MSKNSKTTNQIGDRVRLMQVPSDAVRNAQLTVIESVEGFDDASPGDIPGGYKEEVSDALKILGIGEVIEVDVA